MTSWQDVIGVSCSNLQSADPPHGGLNVRKLECDVVRPCLQVVIAVQLPTHIELSLRASRHSCIKDVDGL